jgi:iron complex transport system substrate-binding protein
MCTDQLLVDLARPEQIAGLSPFARDRARSWVAAKAADFPILSGTAEEILVLRPDLVVAGTFTRRETREFIRARRLRIEEFPVARTVADARSQILRMAALVGAEARGRERAVALDAAMERLRTAARGQPLRVLPLARRGWVAGQDSILTDLLKTAGLTNAAGESGRRAGGFMSLEEIVKLRPDAILVGRDDDRAEDQGRAMLLHPAIAALFPPERRILMSESLTVCGGPMLVEAIDGLAAQLSALGPRRAAPR